MVDSIQIAGFTYKVQVVTHDELNPGSDPDIAGDCDSINLTIRILDTLPPDTAQWVLMHEVVHAFLAHTGMGHLIPDDMTEALCDAIGGLIVLMLRDNPQLTNATKASPGDAYRCQD